MKCCICGSKIIDYGNNPDPVKLKGRCCNECNKQFVVPARILRYYLGMPMREK